MKLSYFIPVFLFLCSHSFPGFSGQVFDNNQNIRQVHHYLLSLRPLSAEKLLKSEETKNPDNGFVTFYRLYGDIITLLIANSADEYDKKLPLLNEYINKLKRLPENAPEYRLLLGEAKVFTGLLRVKYNSKFSGLIECLRGYNLLEENASKYPFFELNHKIPGLIQIGVAFMPKILQWGIKILGIRANPREGLMKLSAFAKYAEGKPGYEEEALLLTMAAYKLMNQEDEVMKIIQEKKDPMKEVVLLNYVAATSSLEANDAELTLQLLSNILSAHPEISFPPVYYLLGKAKMLRLDPDANLPLLTYLQESTGSDYLKTTLYELACYSYISGNNSEYLNYLEKVKNQGRELHNRDIEASFESQKKGLPDLTLLRADFLVRGGYFIRATEELTKILPKDTLGEAGKVQYYYLKGECKRLNNQVNQAESAYLEAIAIGKNSGDYLAQKSLVQAALMMEKNGFKPEAGKYYRQCLNFKAKNNPYSDLYQNKAKAGLIRLSFAE